MHVKQVGACAQDAQLRPLDLATRRLGQLVRELHDPWILVRRRLALDVLLQLARQGVGRLMAVAQHDHRAHHRSALLVRSRHSGGLGDRGMGDERRLDLEGTDAISGGDDHVVGTALEAQVSIAVFAYTIACVPDAAVAAILHRPAPVRLAPHVLSQVPEEEGWHALWVSHELAVDHAQPGARQCLPHRAGTGTHANPHTRHLPRLGLAVAVANVQSRGVSPDLQHLGVERLASGRHPLEAR